MSEEVQATTVVQPSQTPDSFVSELGLTDENLNIQADSQKEKDVLDVINDPFSFLPKDDEHTQRYVAEKKWKSPLDAITEVQKLEKVLEDSHNRTLQSPDLFASPEKLAEYGRMIGRPENPEDYTTQIIDKREDDFSKNLRMHCHNAVMNDFQVQKLAESIEAHDKKVMEANTASYQKELTNLNEEWGDKYNENVKLMKEGVTFLRINTTTINAMEKVLGPRKMREALLTLGAKSRELGPAPSAKNFKASYPTAKSAQLKLDELSNDPEWTAKYNSGDAKAVSDHDKLNEIISKGI